MRTQIHGKGDGTAGGAISALIAGKEVLTADLLYLLGKLVMNLSSGNLNLHSASPEWTEVFSEGPLRESWLQ
jgi:hypothetical protein